MIPSTTPHESSGASQASISRLSTTTRREWETATSCSRCRRYSLLGSSDGEHASLIALLFPAWQAFEEDHANPKLLTEEYWSPHEERSIEIFLEQPVLGAASDVSLPRMRNVIYARPGFKDGRLVAIDDGNSGRAAQRTAKHKATQAQWEIIGLDKAPFHYQIMGRRG